MEIKQAHKILSGGVLTFPMSIVLALLARIFYGTAFFDYESWIVFVLQAGIAFLLIRINHEYQIIKRRTFLPATFFMLLTASNPVLYDNTNGTISAFVMILCIILSFKSYHSPRSQANSFNIALILTIASAFCWQPLLFFIPLFWVGFWWFRAFNARTFFASVLGILTVYLFLFTWYLYDDNLICFLETLPQVEQGFSVVWIDLQWYDWIAVIFYVFLLILSAINIFGLGVSEKIRTTLFFKFLYLLAGVLFVFACFFDSMINDTQTIIYLSIAFISGFYFAINESKFTSYLLIFTMLFFIASYVCRLEIIDFSSLISVSDFFR